MVARYTDVRRGLSELDLPSLVTVFVKCPYGLNHCVFGGETGAALTKGAWLVEAHNQRAHQLTFRFHPDPRPRPWQRAEGLNSTAVEAMHHVKRAPVPYREAPRSC
jgi:hypothetical protein